MDPKSQAELDRLIKLNPEDLIPEDIAFLRARESYLTNDQKRIFANVLSESKAEETKVEAPKVETDEDFIGPRLNNTGRK